MDRAEAESGPYRQCRFGQQGARDLRVRVDKGIGVGLRARAVEGERRERVAADLGVLRDDGRVARRGVRAEPGRVASRRRSLRGGIRARGGGVGLRGGRGGH